MIKEGIFKLILLVVRDWQKAARASLKNFFWAAVNVIFPAMCVICGAVGECVCVSCAARVPNGPLFCCPVCMDPAPEFGFCSLDACRRAAEAFPLKGVVALGSNDVPEIRRLVYALKYEGAREAADFFGARMAPMISHLPEDFFTADSSMLLTPVIVVPVPLHRRRLVERDFNQAELIAIALFDALVLARSARLPPVAPEILRRIRQTERQAHLTGEARRKNLSGAFTVSERSASVVNGARIILVDDVATTGTTLRECACVLRAAGALNVAAIVVGRG